MSDQQPVAGAEQDPLKELYADWSEIMATTPDLTIRLFRSIFDEWHQPTAEPTRRDLRRGHRRRRPRHLVPSRTARTPPRSCSTPTAAASPSVRPPATASSPAHVAKALGVARLRPRLPPGPRAPAPRAGLEDAVAAFLALVDSGIAPARHHDHRRLGRWQPRHRHRPGAQGAGRAAARPGHRLLAVARHGEQGRDAGDERRHRRADHRRAARGHDRRRPRRPDQPAAPAGQPALRRLHRLPAALHHRGRRPSRCSTTPPGSTTWPRRPAST